MSCRPSTLDQPFLSLDELAPGMDVRGEVVAVEPYGAVVKLAPGVKALCPPHHVSDVPGRVTSSKVREGAVLKFRVLSVDLARRRAAVTHKKRSSNPSWRWWRRSPTPRRARRRTASSPAWNPTASSCNCGGTFADSRGSKTSASPPIKPRRGVRAGTGGSRDGHSRGRRRGEGATEPRRRRRVVFKRRRRRGGRGRIRGRRRGRARAGDDNRIRRRETRGRIHRERSRDASGGVPGVIAPAQMSDHPASGAALVAALRKGDVVGPLVALEAKPRRSVLSRKATLVDARAREHYPPTPPTSSSGACTPGTSRRRRRTRASSFASSRDSRGWRRLRNSRTSPSRAGRTPRRRLRSDRPPGAGHLR